LLNLVINGGVSRDFIPYYSRAKANARRVNRRFDCCADGFLAGDAGARRHDDRAVDI
jgi:hypothetical protein